MPAKRASVSICSNIREFSPGSRPPCAGPNYVVECLIHWRRNPSCRSGDPIDSNGRSCSAIAQRSPRFGLNERQKIAQMNVLIQFFFVLSRERARAGFGGKLVDARLVEFRKIQRQEKLGGVGWNIANARPDHPLQHVNFATCAHDAIIQTRVPQGDKRKTISTPQTCDLSASPVADGSDSTWFPNAKCNICHR